MKILVLCLCLVALVNLAESSGCTWLWAFTSTVSTVEWERVRSSHGTLPTYNFTTEFNWWDVTTTTEPLKSTTFAVSHALVTTPPIQPEVIESTDTIFLIIILVSCLIGLIVTIVLVYFICQMTNRKHKKTKRLRVKPLKADQAFMQPAMPMGMGMGLGMDPMGMGGLMPPMDTGMMPGAMDPYGGMDPNAMAAGGMGGDMGAGMGGGMPGGMGGGMPGGMGGGMPGDEKQWMM